VPGFLAHALLLGVTVLLQALLVWNGTAERWLGSVPPSPARLDLTRLFGDPTPVTVTISGAGGRGSWRTTVEEVRESRELWRRMHLADWGAVPEPLQHAALDRMLRSYRHVIDQPAVWDRMTSHDWDAVPQPVRIAAFRRMMAYWSGFYQVGRGHGLGSGEVTRALTAIVMSESWFDHRARARNADGGEDIGLGQASPYARRQLCRLQARGVVDVCLQEADYFNPWRATRFVAVWMSLLLDEAAGDLDLAIRAYNRGIVSAGDRLGLDYGATVQRRLSRFIDNQDAPAAWGHLSRKTDAVIAEAPALLLPLTAAAVMRAPY
jgi:hypothetical protein